MLNSKLRAVKVAEASMATIGRRRLAILCKNHTDKEEIEAEVLRKVAETLGDHAVTLGLQVDRYIERLEIEAEVLERLQRLLQTEIEQIRAFRTRGEPRLEWDVKAQVLKTIKSITEEVKLDAAKGKD